MKKRIEKLKPTIKTLSQKEMNAIKGGNTLSDFIAMPSEEDRPKVKSIRVTKVND